jgi:hypothetical protein
MEFRLGLASNENPFPEHTSANREWAEGWSLARSEGGKRQFWELEQRDSSEYAIDIRRLRSLAARDVLNSPRVLEEAKALSKKGLSFTVHYDLDESYFVKLN